MAKANLPVNFKDDILKENMNGKRRFNMIQNGDGTVSFEDVTDYTQVGSTFGAAQINATNTAVNNAADASKIIDSLETIKANTQSGYIAGALAVKALNSNLGAKIYYLGTGNSFNVSDYPGYKNFTKDNFIIGTNSAFSNGVPYGPTGSAVIGGSIYTKQIGSCAYNNSDGILTINPYTLGIKVSGSEQTITLPMFAYLII